MDTNGPGLTRYYNSQDTASSAFGHGWHSTWHRGLAVSGTSVTVTRADGRQDNFTNDGSGVYVAAPNVTSKLAVVTGAGGSLAGWKLILANDNVETYTVGGQLVSITTRTGLTTTLTYEASKVVKVTGPFGQAVTFSYDAEGRVNRAVAADGRVYAYAYDANNNLISVTYPDGKTRRYVYEVETLPNALTGIIDENGVRFATYAYDTLGRAISTQHANGAELTSVTYNTDGTSTVSDAKGNISNYKFLTQFGVVKPYSLSGAPAAAIGGTDFTYDENGFLASKTDFNGTVTTYTHDAKGNETSRTEAAGTAHARTSTATWHQTLHLPLTVTEPGGRTTSYTYDARGNLLAKTVAAGQQTRIWQYTYNNAGQVTAEADPRGAVTRYTYDTAGNLATVTNALGQVTRYTNYDGAGRLLRSIDPNGLVTTMAYDPRGRILATSVGGEVTSYIYDASGNLAFTRRPDGSTTTNAYDAAHRLTGQRDSAGNGMSYALDANGNRVLTGFYDAANNLVQRRAFAYDDVNRLVGEQGAQGQETDYTYDQHGNLTKVSDPLGHSTRHEYDIFNRRSSSTDAAGGVTRFGYDALDRLVAQQDAKGLTTGYTFDGLDNQTGIASPDTGNTVKTYDVAGNVLTSTDARGMKTTYSYDALGRVLQARYADGTATTYQYDQGANGVGHLTKLTDSAGVTTWTYDQKGRVTSKAQQIGGRSFVTRMSYDKGGRLASLQYPSGKTVTYSYDAAGRVSGIALGRSWLISNITYRPFGPVQSWKQGNNATVTRAYDMDGQLTGISVSGIGAINYTYDAAGRIAGTTETGQANQAYAYDALDRLTHYNAGGAITAYSYDADGNRLGIARSASTASDTYNYTAANNRLMSVVRTVSTTDRKGKPQTKTDIDNFTYDAAGNTLSDGENVYAYDARGRMAGAGFNLASFRDQRRPENDRRKPRLGVKYDINGLGQRIAKHGAFIHPHGHVYYVYDEASHLIGEYDARGNVIEETVYLGNLPIAVLDETGCGFGWGSFGRSSPSVHYITPDNLGAPHIITDSNNKKVWQWNHEPFGNTEPVTATNRSGFFGGGVFGGLDTGFTYDLRFPGQIYDPETGLNYNMARDYNPALGRYVQSDPIGLSGGANTYGYANQNPVSGIDPTGEARVELRFKDVPFPAAGEQHGYVVVFDNICNTTPMVTRAGPSWIPNLGGPAGYIHADHVPYVPGAPDFGPANYIFVLKTDSMPPSYYNTPLRNYVNYVNQSHFQYILARQNSNSFAHAAVRRLGLDTVNASAFALGWDLPL